MRKYNLEERTLCFAKDTIDFCKTIPIDKVNFELINQLIRSATSIGANYREASNTDTRKDFFHKIGICRKEAKETKYWLDLLNHYNISLISKISPLLDEARKLTLIFSTIVLKNTKKLTL